MITCDMLDVKVMCEESTDILTPKNNIIFLIEIKSYRYICICMFLNLVKLYAFSIFLVRPNLLHRKSLFRVKNLKRLWTYY